MKASQTMSLIGEVVDQGFDVRVYCRAILERLRNLLVACVVPSHQQVQSLLELGEEEGAQIIEQAKPLTEPYVQALFSIISRTEDSLRGSSHPRFLIEAAVVRAALLDPQTSGSSDLKQPAMVKPQPSRQAKPPQTIAPRPNAPTKPSITAMPTEKPRRVEQTPERQTQATGAAAMLPSQSSPTQTQHIPEKPVISGNNEPSQSAPQTTNPVSNNTGTLQWELVVDRMIKEHPNVGCFLEKGSVVTLTADQVVIGFSKKDAIARWANRQT